MPSREGSVFQGAWKAGTGKPSEMVVPPSSAMLEVVARVQAEQAMQALDAAMAAAMQMPKLENKWSESWSQASTASDAEDMDPSVGAANSFRSFTPSSQGKDQSGHTWSCDEPWLLPKYADPISAASIGGGDGFPGSYAGLFQYQSLAMFEPGKPAYVIPPSLETCKAKVSSLM
eukprot:gb/GFBE01059580.1/.p1 GENE.gb/GFBE01059580.1/~~gb/GFBE01059580.1/.p1  ORF type:complete len:174 (+),score=46.07 gb/GFBE01059580.1/:1-522(+)